MQGNILRCFTHRYAQVSMTICYESELSGKALGYYTKMQSLDESFHFSIEGFSKLFKDGRDSVRSGIKELEEFGYLVRAQRRAKLGRYSDDTLWITLDEPGLQKELWDYLEERNYEILSHPKREAERPELHLNLDALGVRIDAVEMQAQAEIEDYYRRRFGVNTQKQRLGEFAERGYVPSDNYLKSRYEAEFQVQATEESGECEPDSESAGTDVFHNSQNPRSAPMTDFPTSAVTRDDANGELDVLDALETEMWKTELAVENNVEENVDKIENPRSAPMTDFPTSAVTRENTENHECLPSSEPMTGFPSSENPTQSSIFNCNSISSSNSTYPNLNGTKSQVVTAAQQLGESENDSSDESARKPITFR